MLCLYAAYEYEFELLCTSISNFILLLHDNYGANIVFSTSVQQRFVTSQIVFHKLRVPAESPGCDVSGQRFCKPQTRPRLLSWSYFTSGSGGDGGGISMLPNNHSSQF